MQYTTANKSRKFKKHRLRMENIALLKKWGANLQRIRMECGYRNQADLAAAMNAAGYDITQPGISRAENGHLSKPQEEIADFLIKYHKKTNGEPFNKDEMFSVPVDWQQKYYQLLEKVEGRSSQDRVNQLEGLVSELQKEVEKLKGDKGKEN